MVSTTKKSLCALRLHLKQAVLVTVASLGLSTPLAAAEPLELLIRTDDIGMNHSVNSAMREMIRSGLPFSATVMVPCPWFPEAAAILRDNPQVSVGIHLTLNSEWSHYRWGPVLGASKVPSLVDENGYFFHTAAQLFENDMRLADVEAELRAQIEQAQRAGLKLDFLDYHMLTAVRTPQLRAVVEKLADEFQLGLSHYFGEPSLSLWDVAPERKLSALMDLAGKVQPGVPTLLVMHLATDTPEMNALVDANYAADPYRAALHRSTELAALTSPAFLNAAAARGIRFVTYRDLVQRYGLESMQSPGDEIGYSINLAAEPDGGE
jgi:predicted glycoside hydrolase/deacetylase ChbG (UPF0249 family)